MEKLNLIEVIGINYKGALEKISKSKKYLQLLFEAFTNYTQNKLCNNQAS